MKISLRNGSMTHRRWVEIIPTPNNRSEPPEGKVWTRGLTNGTIECAYKRLLFDGEYYHASPWTDFTAAGQDPPKPEDVVSIETKVVVKLVGKDCDDRRDYPVFFYFDNNGRLVVSDHTDVEQAEYSFHTDFDHLKQVVRKIEEAASV